MVNEYIRKISGGDFTAKDFRTWAGTVQAFLALKEAGFTESESEIRKKIVESMDKVSNYLGNSRSVCKKYYVHPVILSLYESKSLKKYVEPLDSVEKNNVASELTAEEKIVMKILEDN